MFFYIDEFVWIPCPFCLKKTDAFLPNGIRQNARDDSFKKGEDS